MKRQNNFPFSGFLQNYNFLFIIICVLFITGTVFAIFSSSDFQDPENNYISDLSISSLDDLFELRYLILNFVFVFFCGLSVCGVLLLPVYTLFKGFSQSFSFILILNSFEHFSSVDAPYLVFIVFFLFTIFYIFYLFFSFKSSLMLVNFIFKKTFNNNFIFYYLKESVLCFLLIFILKFLI